MPPSPAHPSESNIQRFAFYGRMANSKFFGAQTTQARQLYQASLLAKTANGVITTEYFDIGISRHTPWDGRPQAVRLLAALPDPNRGFEAVVCAPDALPSGSQHMVASQFAQHGVALWLPELTGPLDLTSRTHSLRLAIVANLASRYPPAPRRASERRPTSRHQTPTPPTHTLGKTA